MSTFRGALSCVCAGAGYSSERLLKAVVICCAVCPFCLQQHTTSSSSRMRVMNHNWSATKQRLHPQSLADISRHSVLTGDRIRHVGSVWVSPQGHRSVSVSRHFLLQALQCQQRPLLPREVETRLPDCGVTHQVRIDHLSRLPVTPPSTFDVNWLQIQPKRLPGCQSQQWWAKNIRQRMMLCSMCILSVVTH